ncbi:hypothetical protein KIL84_011856 [Mauremys mutica]|uniref:Uncharacterized protein n=1 Tax=Mauremys mutica TaxID=74926 RepID=A0A9D4B2F2_9SAUR|nr:hypothetical protein KIL84_011856 [Mauremys mutica]
MTKDITDSPFKEPPTLGAENRSEENMENQTAVGDIEKTVPSEEIGKGGSMYLASLMTAEL